MILPLGSTVAILGGGQLGYFLAKSLKTQGYRVAVASQTSDAPALRLANAQWIGNFEDPTLLDWLKQTAQALTFEFENLPPALLPQLEAALPCYPGVEALKAAQNRLLEKALIESAGLSVAPYQPVLTPEDCEPAWEKLNTPKAVLKTATLGYDGKGQRVVSSTAEVLRAFETLKQVPCVLEAWVPYRRELSWVGARGQNGTVASLGLIENTHQHQILSVSRWPVAGLSPQQKEQAQQIGQTLLTALNYVGTLAVELFELESGEFWVNELAPRAHNSGHLSMEAFDLSQFDLQALAVTGKILPNPTPKVQAALMLNLLGNLWFKPSSQDPLEPDWEGLKAHLASHCQPVQTTLHLYGKTQAQPGRKMGHLTLTATTPNLLESALGETQAFLNKPS